MTTATESPATDPAAPTTKPAPKATPKTGGSREHRGLFSIGDKGGSGKSFVLRKLTELHREAKTAGLMLVDGDQTVGALSKFYAERGSDGRILEHQSEHGVQRFGLHGDTDERDVLVDDLLRRGAAVVIADLPATSLTIVRRIGFDYDFPAKIIENGYRPTILAPITPYDDTIIDLQDAIQLFDPEAYEKFDELFTAGAAAASIEAAKAKIKTRADYVAIVNLGLAEDRKDFELWDDAGAFTRQLLAFVGGVEIEMPKLRPRIAAKIAKHRLTFAAGETSEYLSPSDRSRLAKWNADAAAALHKAGHYLALP